MPSSVTVSPMAARRVGSLSPVGTVQENRLALAQLQCRDCPSLMVHLRHTQRASPSVKHPGIVRSRGRDARASVEVRRRWSGARVRSHGPSRVGVDHGQRPPHWHHDSGASVLAPTVGRRWSAAPAALPEVEQTTCACRADCDRMRCSNGCGSCTSRSSLPEPLRPLGAAGSAACRLRSAVPRWSLADLGHGVRPSPMTRPVVGRTRP